MALAPPCGHEFDAVGVGVLVTTGPGGTTDLVAIVNVESIDRSTPNPRDYGIVHGDLTAMSEGSRKEVLGGILGSLMGTGAIGAMFLFGEGRMFEVGGWGWLVVCLVFLALCLWSLRRSGLLRSRGKRLVCQKTVRELVDLRRGDDNMTDIQKEKAVAQFKGQRLTVRGAVDDVEKDWPWGWKVTVNPEGPGGREDRASVDLCFFRKCDVAGLGKGDRLKCTGRIDDITSYSVSLEDCEYESSLSAEVEVVEVDDDEDSECENPRSTPRIWCSTTIPKLIELRRGKEGMTDVQKEQQVESHIRRWIEVRGKVSEVAKGFGGDGFRVTLGFGSSDYNGFDYEVEMDFDARHDLEDLNVSDSFAGAGVIRTIHPHTIYLEDCESSRETFIGDS